MKKGLILLLVGLSLLVSCKTAQDTENTMKKGAGDMVRQIDRSKALSDLTTATAALNAYSAQNDGKFPASLDELKLNLYYPEDMNYDPQTGKVHSKTYPNL